MRAKINQKKEEDKSNSGQVAFKQKSKEEQYAVVITASILSIVYIPTITSPVNAMMKASHIGDKSLCPHNAIKTSFQVKGISPLSVFAYQLCMTMMKTMRANMVLSGARGTISQTGMSKRSNEDLPGNEEFAVSGRYFTLGTASAVTGAVDSLFTFPFSNYGSMLQYHPEAQFPQPGKAGYWKTAFRSGVSGFEYRFTGSVLTATGLIMVGPAFRNLVTSQFPNMSDNKQMLLSSFATGVFVGSFTNILGVLNNTAVKETTEISRMGDLSWSMRAPSIKDTFIAAMRNNGGLKRAAFRGMPHSIVSMTLVAGGLNLAQAHGTRMVSFVNCRATMFAGRGPVYQDSTTAELSDMNRFHQDEMMGGGLDHGNAVGRPMVRGVQRHVVQPLSEGDYDSASSDLSERFTGNHFS